MINQLSENLSRMSQMPAATNAVKTASLEERLALPTNGVQSNSNIDLLYAQLKALWESDPGIKGPEFIRYMRQFVAPDGSLPFSNIASHSPALAQLMKMLKEEGGEASPVYKEMNNGLGLAVVSNGILNSFILKMTERPEPAEEW